MASASAGKDTPWLGCGLMRLSHPESNAPDIAHIEPVLDAHPETEAARRQTNHADREGGYAQ